MSREDELDISRLLAVALEVDPPKDLTKNVMRRLAGVTTALEFGRLVGVAPISRLIHDEIDPDDDEIDLDDDETGPEESQLEDSEKEDPDE
jgi:hypothetical protein